MTNWYEIVNTQKNESEWGYCTWMEAIYWSSNSGNNMIRITYHLRFSDGVARIFEWVNPEVPPKHPLGKKFRERARFFGMADELTIDQALKMFQRARHPDWVKVKPNHKYHDVLELAYEEQPEPVEIKEWEF